MKFLLLIAFLFLPVIPAHAQTVSVGEVTKLPIPRFVSLRGDKVYARTGPGTRYPVKWVYERKGVPVEIIREFDTWRKIRDVDGEEGWVHQSLLSGKRFASVVANAPVPLYREPNDNSRVVALVEPHAHMDLKTCEQQWCSVSQSGFSGWMPLDILWGVYEGEQIQ